LSAAWTDPAFDPTLQAVYCVPVLAITVPQGAWRLLPYGISGVATYWIIDRVIPLLPLAAWRAPLRMAGASFRLFAGSGPLNRSRTRPGPGSGWKNGRCAAVCTLYNRRI
jgi:hypothetical protein